jgi:hypothetical protein
MSTWWTLRSRTRRPKRARRRLSLLAERKLQGLVPVRCYTGLVSVVFLTRQHFTFSSKSGWLALGDATERHCILISHIDCNAPCNTKGWFSFPFLSFVSSAFHTALHGYTTGSLFFK